MPLVGFRPTKARLIIENGKESVLVMRVVLDADDAVELTTGGTLQDLVGVLRIREHKVSGKGNGDSAIGTLVYVADGGGNGASASAKFQVNVAIARGAVETQFTRLQVGHRRGRRGRWFRGK
ncbi:MAG: hypothetical protein ABI624_00750, partial [Casimicrobiaceae bacterium]